LGRSHWDRLTPPLKRVGMGVEHAERVASPLQESATVPEYRKSPLQNPAALSSKASVIPILKKARSVYVPLRTTALGHHPTSIFIVLRFVARTASYAVSAPLILHISYAFPRAASVIAGEVKGIPFMAVFNRSNDSISWARWTWNPVTGCLHNCPYCYARSIAWRFHGPYGWDPTFHPDRLDAPFKTPLPRNSDLHDRCVFVGSMCDLFGSWVPQEWIDAVLKQVRAARQWTFMFLTKNPQRLATIAWPQNSWVGATVDTQARVAATELSFRSVNAPVRFVSCEPLLERVTFKHPDVIDWFVVGAKSNGCRKVQPEWSWVDGIIRQARGVGARVFLKPNLVVTPHIKKPIREYPTLDGLRSMA